MSTHSDVEMRDIDQEIGYLLNEQGEVIRPAVPESAPAIEREMATLPQKKSASFFQRTQTESQEHEIKREGSQPLTDSRDLNPLELDDLTIALSGRKRGRKPGSGLGEKRKLEHEYSTNPHTQKARKRYETMGPHQRTIHSANTAENAAKSRLKRRLKKSHAWEFMNEEDRKELLTSQTSELENKRIRQGYSAKTVKAELSLLLKERQEKDDEFVAKQQYLGVDLNSDVFWVDDDDFSSKEIQDKSFAEDSTETPDLGAAARDIVVGDYQSFPEKKRNLTNQEAKEALMIAERRKRILRSGNEIDKFGFQLFKDEFLGRIQDLAKMEAKLEHLGPISFSENEIEQVNSRWQKVFQEIGQYPHQFISQEIRGLLRCVWAIQDDEWIELPGPASWWPDDKGYFIKHGFEVRVDQKENHRKALEMLAKESPPKGWMKECVHEGNRYDLVWNKFF